MTVIGFLTYSHKHTNKYIHVHSTPSSDLKGTLFPIPRLVDPLAVVKVDTEKVYISLQARESCCTREAAMVAILGIHYVCGSPGLSLFLYALGVCYDVEE